MTLLENINNFPNSACDLFECVNHRNVLVAECLLAIHALDPDRSRDDSSVVAIQETVHPEVGCRDDWFGDETSWCVRN